MRCRCWCWCWPPPSTRGPPLSASRLFLEFIPVVVAVVQHSSRSLARPHFVSFVPHTLLQASFNFGLQSSISNLHTHWLLHLSFLSLPVPLLHPHTLSLSPPSTSLHPQSSAAPSYMPSIFLPLPPAPLLPSAPLRLPSVRAPLPSTPSCCSIRPARRPLCGPRASAPPSSLPLVCSSPPSLDTHWILRILTVLLTSLSISPSVSYVFTRLIFVRPPPPLPSLIAAILSIHNSYAERPKVKTPGL